MIKINLEKLKKLKLNSKNFYVLADFDNTITAKECRTSMGLITHSGRFKKGFTEEHEKICNQYKIKAIAAKNNEIKNEMWNKTLGGFFELFKKYGLTKSMLESIVQKSDIRLREGFLEFISFLYQEKIPLIIISAGVGNFIEIFLKNNHVFYDNITILSNFISFDQQGKIKEIPKNIINPANKNEISISKEIQQKIENREYIVLFGDTPGNIKMMEGKEKNKVLSIAFANKTEHIEELKNKFDIVSEDSKILELLKENKKGS